MKMSRFLLLWQAFFVYWAVAKEVFYMIDLTWEHGSPDGFSREMILVNGTSPGPALIVDQGDQVKVGAGVQTLQYPH
jgi:hypothetical protein